MRSLVFLCLLAVGRAAVVVDYSRGAEPKPLLPYVLDSTLDASPAVVECVERAIEHVANRSCVLFVRHSTNKPTGKVERHLHFTKSQDPRSCLSPIGLNAVDATVVRLGTDCGSKERVCVHELLHALGFEHEHERPERDRYVRVQFNNIRLGADHAYTKVLPANAHSVATPYDLSSVMHYGPADHARDDNDFVLRARNPLLADALGGAIRGLDDPLSHRDAAALNQLFKCSVTCSEAQQCKHGGFLDDACRCVCPYGFSGKSCEKLRYRQFFKVPGCGLVKGGDHGFITTPNYPRRYPHGMFCQWLIEAPKPWQRVEFVIESLDLEYEDAVAAERCNDKLRVWPHGTGVLTRALECFPQSVHKYVKRVYTTQLNWLLVEFKSYSWGQYEHSGFNISYRVVGERPLKDKVQSAEGATEGRVESVRERLSASAPISCYSCATAAECNRSGGALVVEHCEPLQACVVSRRRRRASVTGGGGVEAASDVDGAVQWRGCVHADKCDVDGGFHCPIDSCPQPTTSICCVDSLCNSAQTILSLQLLLWLSVMRCAALLLLNH